MLPRGFHLAAGGLFPHLSPAGALASFWRRVCAYIFGILHDLINRHCDPLFSFGVMIQNLGEMTLRNIFRIQVRAQDQTTREGTQSLLNPHHYDAILLKNNLICSDSWDQLL